MEGGTEDKKRRMQWESNFAKQFLRPILQVRLGQFCLSNMAGFPLGLDNFSDI